MFSLSFFRALKLCLNAFYNIIITIIIITVCEALITVSFFFFRFLCPSELWLMRLSKKYSFTRHESSIGLLTWPRKHMWSNCSLTHAYLSVCEYKFINARDQRGFISWQNPPVTSFILFSILTHYNVYLAKPIK